MGLGSPAGPPPSPGSLRPVVYLPTWARWDVMRQRPQYLMAAFAASGHPAYFVDPREGEERTADGVTIVPTLEGVPSSDVILYVHFAPVRRLFERFDAPAVLYDVLDDLSIYDADEVGVPRGARVSAHHPEVIAAADIVTVSTPVLADRHRSERPDLLLVPNGVDLARFRPASGGRRHDRPVVGYHGAIAAWFDFDLYEEVAAAMPDVWFRIVGPVDPRVRDRADHLARLDNVELLPPLSPDAIPDLVASFDAGTVPFVVDHMTVAVSPLKMYEYMAAGVPVVATPLPACVSTPGVRIGEGAARFAEALRAALATPPAKRTELRAAAEEASWVRRIAPVRDRMDELGILRAGPR